MSCAVQPGGGSEKMRVRYTACRKRSLIAALKHMQAEGMSLCAAKSELHVSAANLSKWVSQGVGKIDHLDKILRSKKKAALTGPVSQLKAIKGALLHYIFKPHEQGVMVNTFMVVLRASFILPDFREKSCTACYSYVKHFLIAHLFSYQMGTHTLQCPPAEFEGEAFNFMQFMRHIISGGNRDRCFVISIYFLINAKQTLEVIGKKQTRRTVRSSHQCSCLRGSRMAALQGRSSHLAITQQPTFTSARTLPGCGQGCDDRLGEQGIGTVCRDSSGSRRPRPDP